MVALITRASPCGKVTPTRSFGLKLSGRASRAARLSPIARLHQSSVLFSSPIGVAVSQPPRDDIDDPLRGKILGDRRGATGHPFLLSAFFRDPNGPIPFSGSIGFGTSGGS